MTTTIGSLDLNSANSLYNDATQYFWFESDSTATYGAGVHITLSPSATFMSNPTGQNILINTDGISIRNGLLPMMTLDNDSLDFNVVDTTNGTYTNVASFGMNTIIGSTTTNRILLNQSYILFRSPTNYMLRSIDNTTVFRDAIHPYEDGEPIFAWESNESGSKTYEWFYTTFLVSNLTGQISLTCTDYTNNTEFIIYRTYNNGVADTTVPSGWTVNVNIPQGTAQLLELTVTKSATGSHVEITNIEFEYQINFNTSTLSCGTYCHYDSPYADLQGATPAFVVGIGQSDANRLDGFFVGYNGDVKVGRDLYLGTAELEKTSGLGGYLYGAGADIDVLSVDEIWLKSAYVPETTDMLTDYIIETDSSGIWKWSKYASGRIECWGEKSWSNVACTTSAGGGYRSADVTQNLPSGLFTTIESCQATMKGSGGSGYTMALRTLCTNTTVTQMFWNSSSATKTTLTVDYYIIGT